MRGFPDEKGFTLIEVLLSIVIFSISLLLFSTFFINNINQSSKQDAQLIAMNLARQTAEQWKNGDGNVTNPTETDGSAIHVTGVDLSQPFTYDVLNALISSGTGSGDSQVKTLALPIGQPINGRIYRQSVTLRALSVSDPDGGSPKKAMVLITVTVTDENNQELATLTTAMANPARG
ncbi:type II secretion system protein [Aneurinibacillus terranovensis]|uniref:type II secretion system protein n=1 Tax=Aneurinibacillus terranovensis TaxID=278991 RepID=UPI0004184F1E|nr:type II secretion system protein [Aneurinibacillus terranovensis]